MSVLKFLSDQADEKAIELNLNDQGYAKSVISVQCMRDHAKEICLLHHDTRVHSLIGTEQLYVSFQGAQDVNTWLKWPYEVIVSIRKSPTWY